MPEEYEFPIDISIPLVFDGSQPNHFGVPLAKAQALSAGDFIGDTRKGGSCNVQQISLIPHCNGTHTECIGHIIDERIFINDVLHKILIAATLISIHPVSANETSEQYLPPLERPDRVITAAAIETALSDAGLSFAEALIIRTLPNSISKKSTNFTENPPAFFTLDAMRLIADSAVRHLLVDLPSLDRMYDNGLLSAHHIFWNVPHGKHRTTPASRRDRTVTEMIYVPDIVTDGAYTLTIQIPNWRSDAAPSRVLLADTP